MFTALVLMGTCLAAADPAMKQDDRAALQPFRTLIGSWKATGRPEKSDDRQKDTWTETIAWEWQFKGEKAWLSATFDKGKYFTRGKLAPVPNKPDQFTLTLTTPEKTELIFTGTLKDRVLTADRTDTASKDEQRIVLSLLHDNRFLYRLDTKPTGTTRFVKRYTVGATKEGEPFASVAAGPECIVTGGKATIKVTYKGVDYWVCCSGCKDAFNEDPEKIIKEAAAKAKK